MKFNFITEDGVSEIQTVSRCLSNILSIPCGSLPLSRGLGVSWSNLSQIPADLENNIATEIIEKIEKYEPRVSVSEVTFSYDSEGMATANIVLEKGENIDEY